MQATGRRAEICMTEILGRSLKSNARSEGGGEKGFTRDERVTAALRIESVLIRGRTRAEAGEVGLASRKRILSSGKKHAMKCGVHG